MLFYESRFWTTLLVSFMLAGLTGCDSNTGTGGQRETTKVTVLNADAGQSGTKITRSGTRRVFRRGGSHEDDNAARRIHPENRKTTEPTVLVSGMVRFDDGAAITTATVELWQDGRTLLGHKNDNRRLDSSPIDQKGRYAVSGSDGTGLSIEVKGISRAIADLNSADERGTAPTMRRVTQDFIIPAPHVVRGRVIDQSGAPINDAVVSLRSEDALTDGWYYGNQKTTATATGEFEMPGVAAGNAKIGAAADGFAATTMDITVPTSAPLTLRLTTGSAVIAGHLLMFPADTPIRAATITARPAGDASTLGLSGASAIEATTDHNGAFRLAHLPAGENILSIKAADASPLWSAPGEPDNALQPKLADNQTTAITLRVFPGYTVTGLVFDKGTSEPLSGAEVQMYAANDLSQQATTGEDGRYSFNRVPDEFLNLRVSYPGFIFESDFLTDGPNSARILLPRPEDSDTIIKDIPMLPVVRVSGRVENREGFPVANAEVKWQGNIQRSETKRSDSDGLFKFELMPFQAGIIEVTAAGYAFHRTQDQVQLVTSDVKDIVIVLDLEATVDGRVVDPKGNPIGGAKVKVQGKQYSIGNTTYFRGAQSVTDSDAKGNFRATGMAPGKNTLMAEAEGFALGSETVTLTAGENKTGVEIKLGEELVIEGRVIDAENNPVEATLANGFMSGSSQQAKTDENGYFRLGGLNKGTIHIHVFARNPSRQKQVETTAGTKDLIIRMGEDEITVRCKVVDSITRRPIKDFKVSGMSGAITEGEPPGVFRFTLQPRHSVNPRISAEGYLTKSFRVDPPDDATEYEQTLEMGTGAAVSGRVISAVTDDPLPNIPVGGFEALTFNSSPNGNTVTDADGRFLISNLPASDVRVTAMPQPPLSRASKSIKLVEGNVTDIGDIKIGDAATIKGRVVKDPSGEPYPGMFVNLNGTTGNESPSQHKQIGADGLFEFPNLQPGTYKVSVQTHKQEVELKPGESKELIFELGSVHLRGAVTRGGQPALAEVTARNLNTGKTYSGRYSADKSSYSIMNIVPGNYEMTVSVGSNDPAILPVLHTETFTVPDQRQVVKDFVLP